MRSPNVHSIRLRLTAWHTLVFGGILVLFAAGTSAFLVFTLNRQINDNLKEDLEIVEQFLSQSPEGSYVVDTHTAPVSPLERYLEVWSQDRRLLYRSPTLGSGQLGGPPDSVEFGGGMVIQSVIHADGSRWRVATVTVTPHRQPVFVRLAVSEEELYSDIRRFVTVLAAGVPMGLFMVALSGYMLARRALHPMAAMASRASRIGVTNLKERIPVRSPRDELGHLATAFNSLLDRVEQSFEELERFTADASHELRSPLTAMRSVGEVGLGVARTPAEYRETIGSMLEEIGRLSRLVDNLLFLSRANEGKLTIATDTVELLRFAQETASLISILAEEKGQLLQVGGEMGIVVSGDKSLLSQALLNLLDNAIKFSPRDTFIRVLVRRDVPGWSSIDVRDQGPGIPHEEREQIFKRFYRLDRRSHENAAGAGLGLSIARWAVEANGGRLTSTATQEGGAVFSIFLPVQKPDLKQR